MVLTDSEELGAEENQACLPEGSRNAEEKEKEVIEDHLEEILDEWKSAKDFKFSTFLSRLLLAVFAACSLASDFLLFVEYLTKGFKESEGNRTLSIEHEQNTFDNYTRTTEHSFPPNPLIESNDQNNKVYGILTLLIQFLPGIQWYTYTTTNQKLVRFLTTIFFPFFKVIFKVTLLMMAILFLCSQVGDAFHQGPKTAETVQRLSTYGAISDSMIQLILQVRCDVEPFPEHDFV